MYNITVNNKDQFAVSFEKGTVLVNQELVAADLKRVGPHAFHILKGTRSYFAEIIEFVPSEKQCVVRINGNSYAMKIGDRFSELLLRLGIDHSAAQKISEVKAPMPGLVLNVMVKPGDVISKDDNLLTLEAMKMENIIKSPVDATVKSVKITLGDKVEKNQVLIVFE